VGKLIGEGNEVRVGLGGSAYERVLDVSDALAVFLLLGWRREGGGKVVVCCPVGNGKRLGRSGAQRSGNGKLGIDSGLETWVNCNTGLDLCHARLLCSYRYRQGMQVL